MAGGGEGVACDGEGGGVRALGVEEGGDEERVELLVEVVDLGVEEGECLESFDDRAAGDYRVALYVLQLPVSVTKNMDIQTERK